MRELKKELSAVAAETTAPPRRLKAAGSGGRPAPGYRRQPFDMLLAWLDPAPERAAETYKSIHHGLVKMFAARGHVDAETLADETIDRVVRKVPELKGFRAVNPESYFYGVARMITLEHRKRAAPAPSLREAVIASAEPEAEAEGERAHECLEKCLGQLSADERDLFLSYYRFEGRNKAANRRHLAESLGISQNALRLRTHRTRTSLRNCVTSCLGQKDAN